MRGENPHELFGYYKMLKSFANLSKLCTVILVGKSPFLNLLGRGISQVRVERVVLQSLKEEHLMVQFNVAIPGGKAEVEIDLFEFFDVKLEDQKQFISLLIQSTLSGIFIIQNTKKIHVNGGWSNLQ